MDPDAAAEEDRGPAFMVIIVTLTSIATLFVGARLYTRAVIKRIVYAEDYFIILTTLLLWAETSTYWVAVQNGEGRHLWALKPEEREAALMWFYLAPVPGVIALGVPKIALAMMLNRVLFADHWASVASWFLSVTSTVNFVIAECLVVFQCSPIRATWTMSITDATCIEKRVVVGFCIYASVFSAFTDIYLALWPALIIFRLEMNMQKSIGLSCVLGLGIFASGVALYKMTLLPLMESPDITYDCIDLMIWTNAEATAILVASSIPMLTPIYIMLSRWSRGGKARDEGREGDSAAEYVQRLAQERLLRRASMDPEAGVVHRPSFRRQRSSQLWSPLSADNFHVDKVQGSAGMPFATDGIEQPLSEQLKGA